MKYFIFIAIILMANFSIFSQAIISGKVTDENGEPVFGVNVSTDRLEGAVTDFDGKYKLEVKSGALTLSISSIGFTVQKESLTIKNKAVLKKDFILKEVQIEIEQTIVYGSKRGKRLEEEVQSVEVIKSEVLKNNNVTDGLQAVELLSGVTVLDGQMSIRGGSGYAYGVGSRVIAVQDEVPVLTPERDEINWDFISTENIDQMELIKGGGAVQYGSSALNGVLSTRSKWSKKKQETEVTLYNTFIGQPKNKEAIWWKAEDNYLDMPHQLGLTFAHRRKMKHNVDIAVTGMLHSFQSHLKDEFNERIRLNFNIRYRPEKVEGLVVGLYTMGMYRNDSFFFIWEGNGEKQYLPSAIYGKRYNYSLIHPFIKYSDKKGNSLNYNGSVYYDARSEKQTNNKSIKVYNDIQYKKKFKFNLNTIVGLTAENYFVKAPALRDLYFSEDEYGWFEGSKYAAYLLGDYKIGGLNISAGARYEVIHLEDKILSSKPTFSLGLNYKISKNNFIRFSFAQAFRLPSIAERYVNESLGPIQIFANPKIQAETGYTSEIGYKRMLNNKKWKGFVDIAIFWTEFDNMIEFAFDKYTKIGDSIPKPGFSARNVARARIFGWELGVEEKVKIGKFELGARIGYTYAYGVDLNQNPSTKNIFKTIENAFKNIYVTDATHQKFEFNPYTSNPNNSLAGILKYRFRHTFKLDMYSTYKRFTLGTVLAYYSYLDNVDEAFITFIPGVGADRDQRNYTGNLVWNLKAAFDIKDKVNFSCIVKNVLNNEYALRPAKPNAPRSFTFQTRFIF